MSGLLGALLPPPHQKSLVVSEPQPKPLYLRGVIFGFSESLSVLKKNDIKQTEVLPLLYVPRNNVKRETPALGVLTR